MQAGITAEWNGAEQGTALTHVLPELQRLETLRASGILQTKANDRGSLNRHGLREKHMCDCLKLNLGSFCHLMLKD
jgi:hypothetical protein